MRRIKKALKVLREEGVARFARTAARKAKLSTAATPYQEKTSVGREVRWSRFAADLPSRGALLDIGSNLGEFTVRAAKHGLWSIGVEVDPKLARRATKLHHDEPNCGFVCSEVDLELCRALPAFDVTLLLSVHHNWHSLYGPEVALEMLRLIASKSTTVIFEGPSRNERYYGHGTPGFLDNDESSVRAYYHEYLQQACGNDRNIKCVGSAPCVGEREPLRWIYVISQ